MRALAYLLGARALDVAREADTGLRWPKPEPELGPLATTDEMAAAWRRWRDADPNAGTPARPADRPAWRRLVPGTSS